MDRLLEETTPKPVNPKKQQTPPLIAAWAAEEKKRRGIFARWASSQVAAYRIGLVLMYAGTVYFGISAFLAGIPAFTLTAPRGWTPIWALVVVIGGVIAAVGSTRAGSEPVTKPIRVFNRIELTGSIMLFLTLGTYATVLLILGYGYGDVNRVAAGAGFVALWVNPTVRMVWLLFRPRTQPKHPHTSPTPKVAPASGVS